MFIQIIFICVVLSYTSAQAPINKEYKLETYFKANWFDANTFCRDHGMQLATVNSNDEATFLHRLLPGTEDADKIWISGSDLGQDGVYKWFSTGKAISFSEWDYSQPIENYQYSDYYDPEAEPEPKIDNALDCVQVSGGSYRWQSVECSTLNYFICETI